MKQLVKILLSMLCLFSLLLSLVACGGGSETTTAPADQNSPSGDQNSGNNTENNGQGSNNPDGNETTTNAGGAQTPPEENTDTPLPGTEGLEYTLNPDGASYSISSIGTATGGDIVIASEYNGLPVTGFILGQYGMPTFSADEQIVTLTVPGSIKELPQYAFSNCTKLTTVTLQNGIEIIGERAFQDCPALKSISIPDSTVKLGQSVFSGCEQLVTTEYNGGQYLGNAQNPHVVLMGAASDITTLTIPQGTKVIASEAFHEHTAIKSITIPGNVRSIGYAAFYLSNIESIIIEDGVLYIDQYALTSYSLTNLSLPNTLVSIEKSALPGLTTLNHTVYENAKYLGNTQNPYLLLYSGLDYDITSCNVHSDTKIIMHSAFHWHEQLSSVSLPEGLKTIGASAFSSTSLASITLPQSLTEIGEDAFAGCKITEVTLPASIVSVGEDAFVACESLQSVNILGNTHFEGQTFGDCTSLATVTLAEGITHIDDALFMAAPALTTVHLPSTLTTIGDSAFEGCTSLTEITLPEGLISIENEAFCESTLQTVNLPSTLRHIGGSAFRYTKLTDIVIPYGITVIEKYTFDHCSRLKNITIPNSVTTIGDYAFYNTGFDGIILPESVRSIGENALNTFGFSDYVLLEKTVEFVGHMAFDHSNAVFYTGTLADYEAITMVEIEGVVHGFKHKLHLYSEAAPTDEGLYWHYVDGVPTAW